MKLNVSPSLTTLFDRGLVWQAEEGEYRQPKDAKTFTAYDRKLASHIANDVVPFGAEEIDAVLKDGGLPLRTIHEFFFCDPEESDKTLAIPRSLPALLARNRVKAFFTSYSAWQRNGAFPFLLVWIGRAAWPTPHFLDEALSFRSGELLPRSKDTEETFRSFTHRCIFIDPPDTKLALWATETALQSPAVAFVAAHCGKIEMPLFRRFSLVARAGNALGLLLRDYRERAGPSMAASRWLIEPAKSEHSYPLWQLSLEKIKGSSPAVRSWRVGLQSTLYSDVFSENDIQTSEALPLRVFSELADRGEEALAAEKFGT